MGLSWLSKLSKVFLVLYNSLFVILGACLLAGGVWIHFDIENVLANINLEHSETTAAMLVTSSLIIIILGVIILIMAFLGCCGACCESVCLLGIYTACLFFILLIEIIGAIMFAIYKADISTSIGEKMYHQVHHEYNKTTTNYTHDVTVTWDMMQIKLQCCGANSPSDYKSSNWYNNTRRNGRSPTVPMSCCTLTNDDPQYPQALDLNQCQIDAMLYPNMRYNTSEYLHTRGCLQAVADGLRSSAIVIITIITIVAILQVVGLVLGCCLIANVRQEDKPRGDYHPVQHRI